MELKVYVPQDSGAVSLGADLVARELDRVLKERGLKVRIVRTGSRGLYWLEPMVEVETPEGRIAYGPVQPSDVPDLIRSGFLEGREHRLRLGLPEQIPYLRSQERLTFARVGLISPSSLEDYTAHGGYRGLQRALEMSGADIVSEVTASGLRGRGGAAFPTGIKWKTALETPADQKYVVCNADEGDSGTFADRMLLEGDPFCVIEGMTIAGICVGATQGYIYIRSEYPHSFHTVNEAIAEAYRHGYLGENILGSGKTFHLEARLGAGAYICGEETALLESLEGKRGMVRFRPPVPAVKGLFGKPTVLNNVVTFASIPIILEKGAQFYHAYGTGRSRGTLTIQLAGNVRRPGLIEKAFGISLREVIYEYGGGTASGRPIKAVQVGGPLGAYLPESLLDVPLDYEAMAARGAMVGHGGIVVFDDTVDMAQMARYAMEFCALESCGKCTPCRIGSTRGVEVIDRIIAGIDRDANVVLLKDLCETLKYASLCALGGLTPMPVLSALEYFPEDFGIHPA